MGRRMTKIGTIDVARRMNARTRVDQPKPIYGWSRENARGNMTPPETVSQIASRTILYIVIGDHSPIPLPQDAIPIARPRFFSKCIDIKAGAGRYKQPKPIPMVTPCARKTCQYSLHRLVMKKPKTDKNEPTSRRARRCPASNIGPMTNEKTNMRKAWTDPIQAMSDDEYELRSSRE